MMISRHFQTPCTRGGCTCVRTCERAGARANARASVRARRARTHGRAYGRTGKKMWAAQAKEVGHTLLKYRKMHVHTGMHAFWRIVKGIICCYTHKRTHARTHVRTHVRTQVRKHVCTYVRTCARTYARTYAPHVRSYRVSVVQSDQY